MMRGRRRATIPSHHGWSESCNAQPGWILPSGIGRLVVLNSSSSLDFSVDRECESLYAQPQHTGRAGADAHVDTCGCCGQTQNTVLKPQALANALHTIKAKVGRSRESLSPNAKERARSRALGPWLVTRAGTPWGRSRWPRGHYSSRNSNNNSYSCKYLRYFIRFKRLCCSCAVFSRGSFNKRGVFRYRFGFPTLAFCAPDERDFVLIKSNTIGYWIVSIPGFNPSPYIFCLTPCYHSSH